MASVAPARKPAVGAAALTLLLLTAFAASVAGQGAELLFAGVVIGTVGLAHGASDLSVVPGSRRRRFLALYLLIAGATLALWHLAPTEALVAFLLLSATHFVAEETAPTRAERWCRALLPVAGPAVLHRESLAALFARLGAGSAAADTLWLAGLAVAALLPLAIDAAARRHAAAVLGLGAGAALLLPPLAGFTVAFTLLHAWPQLAGRVKRTGSADLADYLRRHALILAGAALLVAGAALLFRNAALVLFASLAALATPHMLVTPRFAPD